MGFFRNLFGGRGPDEHGEPFAVVEPAVADAFRRICRQNDLASDGVFLLVGRDEHGGWTLDVAQGDPREDGFRTMGAHGIVIAAVPEALPARGPVHVKLGPGDAFIVHGPEGPAVASDPGGVELSVPRLLALRPELADQPNVQAILAHHLSQGDSQPAVVVAVEPPVVAAYSDELNAVALLAFPEDLEATRALAVGDRLLTVNMYVSGRGSEVVSDLVAGPGHMGRYRNFTPVIADFVAANMDRVAERKAEFTQEEWNRCRDLGEAALRRAAGRHRDGRPPGTDTPAY